MTSGEQRVNYIHHHTKRQITSSHHETYSEEEKQDKNSKEEFIKERKTRAQTKYHKT